MSGDLAAFLAARLDELEAAAKAAAGDDGAWLIRGNITPQTASTVITSHGEFVTGSPGEALHIGLNDPAAVLADVAADRAVLTLMIDATIAMDKLLADPQAGAVDQAMAIGRARGATVSVKHRAARFASHPDYQDKWKP